MPGEFTLLAAPCSGEDGEEDELVYVQGTGRDSENLWDTKPGEMETKNTGRKRQKKKSSREEAPKA